MLNRLSFALALLSAGCANNGHAAQEDGPSASPAAEAPNGHDVLLRVTGMR